MLFVDHGHLDIEQRFARNETLIGDRTSTLNIMAK